MYIDDMKFHGLHGNPFCDFIKNMLSSTVKKYMRDLVKSLLGSGEKLDKLKARDFYATTLSTYDFSTLYTT